MRSLLGRPGGSGPPAHERLQVGLERPWVKVAAGSGSFRDEEGSPGTDCPLRPQASTRLVYHVHLICLCRLQWVQNQCDYCADCNLCCSVLLWHRAVVFLMRRLLCSCVFTLRCHGPRWICESHLCFIWSEIEFWPKLNCKVIMMCSHVISWNVVLVKNMNALIFLLY